MKALLTILIFCSGVVSILACSCASFPDTFCASLNGNETIIQAKVLEKYQVGVSFPIPVIDVEISERFYGEESVPDTISLIGQDGLNCNASINNLDVGDGLLVALAFGAYEGWFQEGEPPKYETYDLFGCGVYYLRLSPEGELSGPIRPGESLMPLQDFLDGLDECLLFSGWTDRAIFEDIATYPNPCTEYISVYNDGLFSVQLRLFNGQGQHLSSFLLAPGTGERIPTDHLPAGIYWLEQEAALERRMVKVIKL